VRSVWVVIPAFNEAENLPWVLRRIPRSVHGAPVHTIVVSDASTDATEDVALGFGATAIAHDVRRGSGAAVRTGFRTALRRGASVVVTIDGDCQHDPRELHRVAAPVLRGEADMVQGSRTLGSSEVGSALRAGGVATFARVLTALTGSSITDPSTGYCAISAAALRSMDLRQDQFYVSELILQAARQDLRIMEVPITMRRRASGTTKKPPPARYAWGYSKAIVKTLLR